MKLNKLESEFFDKVLCAGLAIPVPATLEYQRSKFDLIVVPEIDARGYFVLKYYNAPMYDPEPQTNDDGTTTKKWSGNAMFGTHPLFEAAWHNRDLVSIQLFPSRLPCQRQDRPKLYARMLLADHDHRGHMALDKNEVSLRDAPIKRAEFCLMGFPDFEVPGFPSRIRLDTHDGWHVVVTREDDQPRDLVSHTGAITRDDESDYTADELGETLLCLRYFFAFVAGLYIHPTVIIGYDSTSQPVWGAVGRFDQERSHPRNWFNHSGDLKDGSYLESLFPMFWRKWQESQSELIAIAERYVNSTVMLRAGIPSTAVATSYSGLEILASLASKKTIAHSSHLDIEKVLSDYNTPHLLLESSDTPALQSLCKSLNITDLRGCHLLGEVRNYITHPLDRTAAAIKSHHLKALEGDAMRLRYYFYLHDLCQFYLEYAFLTFCGYEIHDFRQLYDTGLKSGL